MEYRDELIQTYFRSLDEAEYSPLESVFSEDVKYRMPSETIRGHDSLMEYFRNDRLPSKTNHDLSLRIHGDSASAVEGHVTGEIRGRGEFDGNFVDIFEFDEERKRIERMSVYSNFDIPASDDARRSQQVGDEDTGDS